MRRTAATNDLSARRGLCLCMLRRATVLISGVITMPWWGWLLTGVGALIVLVVLAIVGVVLREAWKFVKDVSQR